MISYKLQIAKMAYNNTLDIENYYLIFNSLQWSSSKKELEQYIAVL